MSGAILLGEAVVIAIILAVTGVRIELPVTTGFAGALTSVELGTAVVVLLAFCGILRLMPRDTRMVEFSQVSGIAVFLVAQLTGISDVTALVPLYAIAAGAPLFLVLHARDGDAWAFAFGASLGIVPWGVIAFVQIGSGLVGEGPSAIVRIVTLGMLALAIASWAVIRLATTRPSRLSRPSRPSRANAGAGLALATLTPSALAWFAVLAGV